MRGEEFSQTIDVLIEATEEEFNVTDVSVLLNGDPEPISIGTAGSSITLAGKYLSGWDDVFTYVSAGGSDKIEEPKTAKMADLPDGQALYSIDQDQNHFITRTYDVTVTYVGLDTETVNTETIPLRHEVFNDLESIRFFMANYNYGEE